jgi:hypothetical protein
MLLRAFFIFLFKRLEIEVVQIPLKCYVTAVNISVEEKKNRC